jgi:membrane carboxypeptidase/penicillin-binding protein
VSILAVSKADGTLLESREVKMRRVAPAGLCYVMNDILKDDFIYGTGSKARQMGFDRPFAGKTGTTSNYRDAWFIGYSPRILSLVWIGFDDGHSVRLAGGDACVPIWTNYMNRVIGAVPDVDWRRPDDVVERDIDPESGGLATPWCPQTRQEVYVAGTEPTQVCPLHGGTGEPNFVSRQDQVFNEIPSAQPGQPAAPQQQSPQQQQQPQQAQPQRQPRTLRRLLRSIFGGQ